MYNCDGHIVISFAHPLSMSFVLYLILTGLFILYVQGWINVTKRLRGDDNVDGTCIPQVLHLYNLFNH